MSWLQPAIIATLSNSAILSIVYLYLFLKEGDRSLFLFFISWLLYSLRFVMMLSYVYFEIIPLLVANQLFVVLSSHLLLVAFNSWLQRTPSPFFFNILSIISILWIILIGSFNLPFSVFTLPIFFYVGYIYVYIGYMLLRNNRSSLSGVKIVALTLIIWGLHKINYPFLRPIDWIAPWGYLFAGFLAIITALGMILIYFEDTKHRLHHLILEKETLIKEIHHRVKNNLSILYSLLRYHLSLVQDKSSKEIFKKLEDKIFSFVLIHTLLYQSKSIDQIDFGQYIIEVSEHLVETYDESKEILSYSFCSNSILMDIYLAQNLGLIVNELLTNALKHAFLNNTQKMIQISLQRKKERHLSLIIEDNGIGISTDFEAEIPKMSGLYLVKMLCKEINGRMAITNTVGTKVEIIFEYESIEA